MTEDPQTITGNGWAIYRRLLSYTARYWVFFLISVVGYVVYASTQTALAHLMKYFVDGLADNADEKWIYIVPLASALIAAIRGVGYFFGSYFLSRVSLGVVNDLRKQLFDHILMLPSAFHDEKNSGELVSMITYNVNQVSSAATQAIKIVLRDGLMVVGLLAYLLYMNWQLTLAFIVIAPIMAVLVAFASKRFKRLSEKMQVSMGQVTHVSSESIQGYRLVRSYLGEAYEKSRFHKASDDNTKQGVKFSRIQSLQTPILQMILAVALAGVMYMALLLSKNTGVTPGDLVAYVVAAGLVAKPVRSLSEVNAIIQRGLAAAESVFYLLDTAPEPDSGVELGKISGRITLAGVCFSYNEDVLVLDDINLAIEPDETVAIVGRSGSGKSTLASLLMRFYQPGSGIIKIDDVALNDVSVSSLRRQVALVNQQVMLFNDTVANNIAYGELRGADLQAITAAAEKANALEFINKLPDGMETMIGEGGARLSGGQRQRLAIARALLKDAPILILDEATSALDTESEKNIQDALDAVIEGRTTIVIAHRLSTIENADRIIVMDSGKIAEQGNHAKLIAKRSIYSKLHAAKFEDS